MIYPEVSLGGRPNTSLGVRGFPFSSR